MEVEWIENQNDGSFGQTFSFGTASDAQQRAIDAAPGALVLSLPVDLHRERAAIASLGRALARAARWRCASSNRSSDTRWSGGSSSSAERTHGLYRAGVVVLGGKDDLTTCGMQVFSLPDAHVALDDDTDAKAANALLAVLNVYQVTEDPVLVSGHTFSTAAEAPKRVLQRWPERASLRYQWLPKGEGVVV